MEIPLLSDLRPLILEKLSQDAINSRRQAAVAELFALGAQMNGEPQSMGLVEDAFHTLTEIAILTPRVSVQ